MGLRLSQAVAFIKTGGHFVESKEITINNCAILCRCRSFNPSLCRLSLFCCSLSLFQGHYASVSKFSLTGPQESGQNKCNLLNRSMYSIYYIADINECEAGKHHCDFNAFCNNTKGSYFCTCKPGYNGNGVNCTGKLRKR